MEILLRAVQLCIYNIQWEANWRNHTVITILVFFWKQSDEAYICIYSVRDKDVILFCHEGGIDIGNVEDKACTLDIPIGESPSSDDIKNKLLSHIPSSKKE